MPPDLSGGPGLPGWDLPDGDVGLWRRAGRFARRNRHVTIPLAVVPAMMTAAEILHREHLGTPVAIAAGIAALAAAFRAPHHWDRPAEVAYAQASVFAGGAWLSAAACLGVRYGWHHPGLHYGMEYLLAAGSAGWGIPWWLHKRPRGKRGRRAHEREVAGWNRWWQMHAPAWGVAGSGIVDVVAVESHGTVVMESLLIQLWGGRQTHATIKNLHPLIESSLRGYVAHGMTRSEVNKADPSQVWLHVKIDDPLREEIAWDYSMVPGDITLPAPLGTREGGELLEASLRSSFFILGKTRSGKSNELSVMLAAITACRNARTLMIDMKGGRAGRPWLPAVDWLATTIEEARLVLACGVAEVKARAADAYNGGDEQLEPTDDVPTLFIVIDETREVTSTVEGDTKCRNAVATIATQGAGVEVYLIILTQYGRLDESVGSDVTRSNLDGRLCFQTAERAHGTFALGDDAYNKVDTTRLASKGEFYYRANSDTWLEQIRGPHVPHRLVREIAARNATATQLHERPLELYATDWQETYDMRWTRLPRKFWNDAPQVAHLEDAEDIEQPAAAPAPPPREPDEMDRLVADINAEIDEAPAVTSADIARAMELRAARGEGPPDLRADHDQRRRLFAHLLQSATGDGITPVQLQGSGIGRTMTFAMIKQLTEAGVVTQRGTPGSRAVRYLPSGDVWEAMEALERAAGRLAAEARELAGV
jgi:hypothetical protein